MQKHLILFALLVLSASTQAFALVDGQLLVGKRNSTFDSSGSSDKLSATELVLSVHVDPIPLIPVAAGLYYVNQTFDAKDDGEVVTFDTFKGSQIGLEVMAWLPLKVVDIEPYAKLGYTFFGKYTAEADDVTIGTETGNATMELSSTGLRYAVGARWNILPILGLLLEVSMANDTFKFEEYKFEGSKLDIDGAKDIDVTSMGILLGVQAGL